MSEPAAQRPCRSFRTLRADRYRVAAATTLTALADHHLNRHGGLIDGCYNRVKNLAISNELICGNYFLLETALALDAIIDPTWR